MSGTRLGPALILLVMMNAVGAAETFVLSVGVERYDDPRIATVAFAATDAEAIGACYRAAGVPTENVVVLASAAEELGSRPTRANLLAALERFGGIARADDRLVLFFAGHGVEDRQAACLLTGDTRLAMITATALPVAVLTEALAAVPVGQVLLLVDAAHGDPVAARGDRDAPLTDGLARGMRPLLERGRAARVATLLACGVGQRSWVDEGRRHGVFATALLTALGGTAADAAGRITLARLAEEVRREVTAWATGAGKSQTPNVAAPEGEFEVLVRPREPVVTLVVADQPLAKVIEEVERQTAVRVELGEAADGGLKVSGRLERQPVGAALAALTDRGGLRVRFDGQVYVIERAAAVVDEEDTTPPDAETVVVSPRGKGCRTITEALAKVPPGGRILVRPGCTRRA